MKTKKRRKLKKGVKRILVAILALFVLGGIVENSSYFNQKRDETYSSLKQEFITPDMQEQVVEEVAEEAQDTQVEVEEPKEVTPVVKTEEKSTEEFIWDYLRAQGFTEIQTAAIIGNMYQESNLNPAKVESNGIGIGLIQWSYGRRENFEAYAKANGKDWTDIEVQLDFFMKEWKSGRQIWGSNKEKFENPYSVTEATEAFCWGFERPRKQDANLKNRTAKAWEAYYRNEGR